MDHLDELLLDICIHGGFLIRNMADENEWNFWDYLCGGVNAVFGAIGSIARPFGDGNDFARLREKKENGKAREILIGIAVANRWFF